MQAINQVRLNKQKGAAAVETIVLLVVMVPLFSALPLLGKMSDINNATIQSSRYLAWERTVSDASHKSVTSVAAEVNNRFFRQPDFHIKSNQGTLSAEKDQNLFWTGFGEKEDGSTNRLVASDAEVYVSSSDWERSAKPSGLVGTISLGIKNVGAAFSAISGQNLGLEWKGLVTTTVGMDVAINRFFPSGLDCNNQSDNNVFLCMKSSNSILVDSWSARDNAQTIKRTKALVPSAALEGAGNAIARIGDIVPLLSDIKKLKADGNGGFGYVHKGMVPLDRYIEP